MISLRRWLRWTAWLLAALVALPLLLFVLWAPFNMIDAPARPVPQPLRLVPPTLTAAENMAYALEGLRAAEGSDPARWGRQQWEEENRRAAMSFAQLAAAARTAKAVAPAPEPALAPLPQVAPWTCSRPSDDCTGSWLSAREALAAQRQSHTLIGRRCEAIVDSGLGYEELRRTLAGTRTQLPSFQGSVFCLRWFHTGALLAWAQRNPAAALAELRRADHLLRAQLGGSHSLIGHMVAQRMARHQLQAIGALAVRDMSLAPQLAPLLADWPDPRVAIRRWMAFEAAYSESVFREIASCAEITVEDSAALGIDVVSSPMDRFLQCRLGIGLQPEHALQLHQDAWLRRIARVNQEPFRWTTLLDQERRERAERDARPWGSMFAWRNSIGHILVNVAAPAFDGYMARHADTELHRALVQLALTAQAQGIPRTERAAWLARQALPEVTAGRLTVSDDGRTISARSWQELGPDANPQTRDRIDITWPD